MSHSAVHLRILGDVQGVYYRASAAEKARELGLAGWVRNETDGSVELFAEGDPALFDNLIAWCRKGPPAARVSDVKIQDASPQGLKEFEIRH